MSNQQVKAEKNPAIQAGQGSKDIPLNADHTPLPWRVGGHPHDNSGSKWREILTDAATFNPAYICQAYLSDAELIVRAVNAHDALVSALREIAAFDDEGANARLVKTGSYSSFDEPGSVQIARAALALAEMKS